MDTTPALNADSNDPTTIEMVTAYCVGELDQDQAARVEAAVAGSPVLARMVAELRGVIRTLSTDDSVSPSRALTDRAKAIAAAAWDAGSLPGRVARWFDRAADAVASLVFDSRAQLAAAGFRGGSSSGTQLAFECDGVEIDLMASEPESAPRGQWIVQGQVDAADRPVRAVAMLPADRSDAAPGDVRAIELIPDDRGQFRFTTTSPIFGLRVLVGDRVIDVGPVHLQ